MSLEPNRIEIDCVFTCPSCGTETWHTIRELKIKKHLNCPCGTKTPIQPVNSVKVTYAGKATGVFDSTGKQTGPIFPADDFVASLVALGYRKRDAVVLVENNKEEYDGNDNKFITLLLQQGALA